MIVLFTQVSGEPGPGHPEVGEPPATTGTASASNDEDLPW